jgi:ferredoxin
MPRVTAIEPGGREQTLEAEPGSTIQELARAHDLPLECTCGGQMACATCHVVIDPSFFGHLPPASAEEKDMLLLSARPRRTSRLGCQVRLTDELDGLRFTVVGE